MLLMQILDVVALHLLFAALGFCQARRSAAARNPEVAQGSVNWAGIPSADGIEGIERPILGERLRTESKIMAYGMLNILQFDAHGRSGMILMEILLGEALNRCKISCRWPKPRDSSCQRCMTCSIRM